jgi:hypothetical protein
MTTWTSDKALDDIRRVGWHILGIEGDATTPNVAHTVGLLKSFQHPEIVVVGLKVQTMMQMLGDLGERVAQGAKLTAELDDVLEGFSVRFEAVLPVAHERFLPAAREFYGDAGFSALQCVWPDKDRRFPDDLSFANATVEPCLGDPEWTPIYATWPFEDSYVLACFTTRFVLDGSKPITLVTHDNDGSWQFLCGTTNELEDCKLIALQSAVKIDPSVMEVADLPRNWSASRQAPGAEWVRAADEHSDGDRE